MLMNFHQEIFLSENFEKIPNADNSNFIDQVMKICLKHKVDVIFTLVTKELFLFSNNIGCDFLNINDYEN